MLRATERLDRRQFAAITRSKDIGSIYNHLGTLKYVSSTTFQVSIVISAKVASKAVVRNTLKRRLYTCFREYNRKNSVEYASILYVSKHAPTFTFQELKTLLYELIQKSSRS